MSPDRLSKLPQWAKAEVLRLRAELAETRRALAASQGQVAQTSLPLPRPEALFQIPGGQWMEWVELATDTVRFGNVLEVRWRAGGLDIHAGNPPQVLVIRPTGSVNNARIEPEDL